MPKACSLPFGMRYLTALEKLQVQDCEDLNFSENDFPGLTRLKILTLSRLPSLMSLPKGIHDAAAPTLCHLVIDDCPNILTISESLGYLTLFS